MVIPTQQPQKASPEAIFRYLVVSEVLGKQCQGTRRSIAVKEVKDKQWLTLDGNLRRVGKRTLYRWLNAYEGKDDPNRKGLRALEPRGRTGCEGSLVLPQALLDYLADQKEKDVSASIPEVIRRARWKGIIDEKERIDRTTLYRAARRLGIPVKRCRRAKDRDSRRYAFPNRMQCVLCDGKHFRAGSTRAKRVAYFFLDDATRCGLHAVVGTSENAALFLRSLYELIRKYGYFQILYIDKGPGFIALDVAEVVDNFERLLIHGQTAYPEAHGKIERFNQTALNQVLRNWDHRPEIDPDCNALELRLNHFLSEVYNHTIHESLKGQTPWQRFHEDKNALYFPHSDAELRQHFVVHFERTMSNDHVVSIYGTAYEMPFGYREKVVTIHHHLLDNCFSIVHDGKLIELQPVDLAANARNRRVRETKDKKPEPSVPLPPSAADMAFKYDFSPVVDATGGLADTTNTEKEKIKP